jgi:hypothetical protein
MKPYPPIHAASLRNTLLCTLSLLLTLATASLAQDATRQVGTPIGSIDQSVHSETNTGIHPDYKAQPETQGAAQPKSPASTSTFGISRSSMGAPKASSNAATSRDRKPSQIDTPPPPDFAAASPARSAKTSTASTGAPKLAHATPKHAAADTTVAPAEEPTSHLSGLHAGLHTSLGGSSYAQHPSHLASKSKKRSRMHSNADSKTSAKASKKNRDTRTESDTIGGKPTQKSSRTNHLDP